MPTDHKALTRTYYSRPINLDRCLIVNANEVAEQIEFFMENGYVVIKQAFTQDQAAAWTETMWIRLGLDPDDKSTWTKERIHMPFHKKETVASFAPKVGQIIRVAMP